MQFSRIFLPESSRKAFGLAGKKGRCCQPFRKCARLFVVLPYCVSASVGATKQETKKRVQSTLTRSVEHTQLFHVLLGGGKHDGQSKCRPLAIFRNLPASNFPHSHRARRKKKGRFFQPIRKLFPSFCGFGLIACPPLS